MKGTEQANRTLNNPINTSSSKYQYSFGRQNRFKQRRMRQIATDKFYDLPSQFSKKGATIGREQRDFQRQKKQSGPPPGHYNPHRSTSPVKAAFAAGRDECKANSVFYDSTTNFPGPGKYEVKAKTTAKAVYMSGKTKTTYETISPGPKYNFESTLLDRNKILSTNKKASALRIVLPNNSRRQSRMSYTQVSQPKQSMTQSKGYITYKGKKGIGKSCKGTIIGQEQRFRPTSAKVIVPGPGKYEAFSDFIGESKK